MEPPRANSRTVDYYGRFGHGLAGDVWTGMRYMMFDYMNSCDMIEWMLDYKLVCRGAQDRFRAPGHLLFRRLCRVLRDFLERIAPERLRDLAPLLDKIADLTTCFPKPRTEIHHNAPIVLRFATWSTQRP